MLFWQVMTGVAGMFCLGYGVISVWGERLGISADRRRKFHQSSILLIGWTAVCVAHLLHKWK